MGTSADKRFTLDATHDAPKRTWSEMPMPETIRMNLTHRCNFRCDMCTQYGPKFKNDNATELPPEAWINVLTSVRWARPTITIFGGEPTLYPHLPDILKSIAQLGLASEIVSNGSFLLSYLPDLAAAKTKIFLSVDGTGYVHDQIRNAPGSFQTIKDLLPSIHAYGLQFDFNYVLTPDNIYDIRNFLAFCLPYNPISVTFQHLQFASKGLNRLNQSFWKKYLGSESDTHLATRKKYQMDDAYVTRLREELIYLRSMPEYGDQIRVFPDLTLSEVGLYYSSYDHFLIDAGRRCRNPWTVATIDPNGDLALCLDYFVGNVAVQDFWSLWDGAKSNKFREQLECVGRLPICSRCCEFYVG